ncbi:MAG: hypothetical protein C0480_04235 [Bradyrhizobium sp.]|nr:hypothetical protein [Bradyrhizobium sp.]
MTKPTLEELKAACERLVEKGLLIDSGQRRPNKRGEMEIVWTAVLPTRPDQGLFLVKSDDDDERESGQ